MFTVGTRLQAPGKQASNHRPVRNHPDRQENPMKYLALVALALALFVGVSAGNVVSHQSVASACGQGDC